MRVPVGVRTGVSVMAITIGLGLHAFAQDGGETQGGDAFSDQPLDEISVTATRQEEPAIDALAGASVVNRSQIQSQQIQRIGTIFNQIPGVSVQENPDDPATAINIRGLQDFGRVAVTVDGARQNFQRSGHNANGAFFLDPAFVRSIDVTRGPVANIYGSGAIGGVVSFQTVSPRHILRPGEKVAAELSGNLVANAQQGGAASAIGAFRMGIVSGLLGFSYRKLGAYRDGGGNRIADSGQELKSGIAKIEVEPGEGQRLVVGAMQQHYSFANGPGTAREPRRENDIETRNLFAKYTFNRPDIPWLNLSVSIYDTSTDTNQVRVSGTPAQIGASRFFRINTQGFDVFNTSRFPIGDASLAVTYGVDGFRDRVRTSDPFGAGAATTPGGERTVFGSFVQAHLKWSIFEVIGAARYDSYQLESLNRVTRSSGSRVSPKITFGVSPWRGVTFYTTYAEGYRAPAITETLVSGLHPPPAAFTFIPNPTLRPEVGKTIEGGVNLKFDDIWRNGDRLRAKVGVFRNDVDDYIESVFNDPGAPCGSPVPFACADATFTYMNISKARLYGVEAEASYDARAWFMTASGSLIRGDDRTARQPLTSVHPAKFTVGGGMRFFGEKLTLGARVTHFQGQSRLPPASIALRSKAYTLLDLYANYEIKEGARAFLTVTNLGNVRYRQFRFSDHSPGTVVRFGLSTRFGS